MNKSLFIKKFKECAKNLKKYVADEKENWKIKGFIDLEKQIFTISNDTKLLSKIIELHIFPQLAHFAKENHFILELPDSQNYYPDLTFIYEKNTAIKYAVDIKTTFVRENKNKYCEFTLGSHGSYFIDRRSKKNIQHPYREYKAHFVLGIIYRQNENKIDETKCYKLSDLEKIESVIGKLEFFFIEKWKIATDRQGSGNTANIGGLIIKREDMDYGNGIFKSEKEFDEYWMNYGKIKITDVNGNEKTIKKLADFRKFKRK